MPSFWLEVVSLHHPFGSRYALHMYHYTFALVRGRWNIPTIHQLFFPWVGSVSTPGHTNGSRYIASGLKVLLQAQVRNEKQPKKLWTSGGHLGGCPGSKTLGRPSKPCKNNHFGADIDDPNARTSMTPRGFKKPSDRKLWPDFSFPRVLAKSPQESTLLQ